MAILENEFKESYTIFVCLLDCFLQKKKFHHKRKERVSQSIEKQSLSIKFAHPIEETKYVIEKYALFWLSQTEPSLKYGNATEYRL